MTGPGLIAALAMAGIVLHFLLTWMRGPEAPRPGLSVPDLPLAAVMVLGGLPLLLELGRKILRRELSADVLAGLSIVTAALLGQYLAGAIVVLMLSGGRALESRAVRNASSALDALAKRMPAFAHLDREGAPEDVPLDQLRIGDKVIVMPHESCPVDGIVLAGDGTMDESYLTGEPYLLHKGPGSRVLSGAVNGETALTVLAEAQPGDSRHAKIMRVMKDSAQARPKLRRVGDRLGAVFAPVALLIAIGAWAASGEAGRFLAVLVVATPCPLLIAIPVAVIGSISQCAKRGIIIKDPAVLEKVGICRTAIFDKTGTLTYGRPVLVEASAAPGVPVEQTLADAASLERYSRHPLAGAMLKAAEEKGLALGQADEIREIPGRGLAGKVQGREVRITGRRQFLAEKPGQASLLPPSAGGLECVVLRDGAYAATFQFRDAPRASGAPFVRHLGPKHRFRRILLVSGDRESEVRYLAEQVGITEIHASQTPEQKLDRVRAETRLAPTLFMGDGINDAPALTAATVGIAFGQNSDVTSEAAGAVILESSLQKVDELLHTGRRMRALALQSAVGGLLLSFAGMWAAAFGYLTPVAGAVVQEGIDLLAILNALRIVLPPRMRFDF